MRGRNDKELEKLTRTPIRGREDGIFTYFIAGILLAYLAIALTGCQTVQMWAERFIFAAGEVMQQSEPITDTVDAAPIILPTATPEPTPKPPMPPVSTDDGEFVPTIKYPWGYGPPGATNPNE